MVILVRPRFLQLSLVDTFWEMDECFCEASMNVRRRGMYVMYSDAWLDSVFPAVYVQCMKQIM